MKILSSKPVWLALRQLRKIWVRVVLFAVLALASVAAAQTLGTLIPTDLAEQLGADSVDQVLTILASSMLAVTTFSLSISVSAFASAASSATPRATELLQEDSTTQNVLATFLGAFLFSLVGIVALKAGYYTQSGTFVLFAATVVVIVFVLVALIRWISHLTDFGRMNDTLDRVELAATEALTMRLEAPWLRGMPKSTDAPDDAVAIPADEVGYVQHIDMEALSDCASAAKSEIWIETLPGEFVHSTTALARATGAPDTAACKKMRAAFTIGRGRNFEQDPRFGMVVLSEIASRALSPAVNDPGTAIDVLGRIARIISPWRRHVAADCDYPAVHVPTLLADELLDNAIRPIARDGAGVFEVQMKIQKTLAALVAVDEPTFGAPARHWSRTALAQAEAAGIAGNDLEALRASAP